MNMKPLAFVIPPSIYHGCPNWKTFWKVKFKIGEFTPVNMKNCGRCNVRKHIHIKDSDKYTTLEISLKFGSLENMIITYSEPKYYLGGSVKGLIIYLGINTNANAKEYKKEMYAITNISMKDISNIIKEFEKLPYKVYVRKRPKHEPTDSYFYLARYIYKCMMISDDFNSHIDPVKTEMPGTEQIPISHVCDSDESE